MRTQIYFFAVLIHHSLAASLLPCPEGCVCSSPREKSLRLNCSTVESLRHLKLKQIRILDALTIRNSNVTEIDAKVFNYKFENLKVLDLSNNSIARVPDFSRLPNLQRLNLNSNVIEFLSTSMLPKNLVSLDISFNLISDLPKYLISLKHLRFINVCDNPIVCSCSVLAVRDALLKAQVAFREPVLCHSPEEYHGKSWHTEGICSQQPYDPNIWDTMQGDEPQIEGSGSGDFGEDLISKSGVNMYEDPVEEGYIPDVNRDLKTPVASEDELEEGSGDALTEEEYSKVKPQACLTNCSTPPPIDDKGGNDTQSMSFFDSIKTIFDDLTGVNAETPVATTTQAAVTEQPVKEWSIAEVAAAVTPSETVRKADVDVLVVNASEKEKEKVEQETSQSNSVHILLFLLGAFLILLILYALVSTLKKKNKRRRNRTGEYDKKDLEGMTELENMASKPDITSNNVPERVPLMNGQNGTQNGKPNDELDYVKDEAKNNLLAAANGDDEYVELRKKLNKEALLTPETKRVTIRAGEIPGSVPRTPLLVERHVSSDGNIITTPSPDQRI